MSWCLRLMFTICYNNDDDNCGEVLRLVRLIHVWLMSLQEHKNDKSFKIFDIFDETPKAQRKHFAITQLYCKMF